MTTQQRTLVDAIRADAQPISGADGDYDRLLDLIGDARLVLIGEASHGTHEFYAARAAITRRLIAERGFTAVAVEADWPDAYRVNCFVRGAGSDPSSDDALAGFKRFPTWMWRNTVVRDFVAWLRTYNATQPAERMAGFYGLDLYSLHLSIEAVLLYLDRIDPPGAAHARSRYACFDHLAENPQEYGYAASYQIDRSCQDAVVAQLVELQRNAAAYTARDGRMAEDEYFAAEQNARLAKNAEDYYRTMFRGHVESWNVRDCHMAETLEHLIAHLDRHGGRSKVVVWAHNSHLGDARATDWAAQNQLNLGQLVRQRYTDDAVLIGFSTYSGTVTAAQNWDEHGQRRRVRPALPGSYEALLHEVGLPHFWLSLRGENQSIDGLLQPRLERAIGVIYRPETERWSHYFEARLPDQFDAVIHLDQTSALEPLEPGISWQRGDEAETFPSGM